MDYDYQAVAFLVILRLEKMLNRLEILPDRLETVPGQMKTKHILRKWNICHQFLWYRSERSGSVCAAPQPIQRSGPYQWHYFLCLLLSPWLCTFLWFDWLSKCGLTKTCQPQTWLRSVNLIFSMYDASLVVLEVGGLVHLSSCKR